MAGKKIAASLHSTAPTGNRNPLYELSSATRLRSFDLERLAKETPRQSGGLMGGGRVSTYELVNLIKAQSNYQANAKAISTQSTIIQTIIQMT